MTTSRPFWEDPSWRACVREIFPFATDDQAELLMLDRMSAPPSDEEVRWVTQQQRRSKARMRRQAGERQSLLGIIEDARIDRLVGDLKRRRDRMARKVTGAR